MGGSQSAQVNTNILNSINTEIDNVTKTITNTVNSSTTQALNSLISNNTANLNAKCQADNNFNMSNCDVTGGILDVVQTINASCVNEMMAKIKADTSWQQKFSAQLNSSFASAVKNNNSVVQAMDAKSVLTKNDANTDLRGAISNIMNTLGSSAASLTGTKVNKDTITNVTNIFNTLFSNKTYTKNDIQNIINNINKNTVVINTTQGCNLNDTALNSAVFDNCDFNNNILILNQSASVKSLQSCSQGVVSNMLTSNQGIMQAVDTLSATTSNTNTASSLLTQQAAITITKTNSGSLLGMLGLGNFGMIIMIVVITIVIAVIIVIIIKVMKSKKSGSNTGNPDVSNLSSTSDITTPLAELGESGLSKVGESGLSKVGESGLSKVGESGLSKVGESGLSKVGESGLSEIGESGLSKVGESGLSKLGKLGEKMIGGRGLSKMPNLKSLGFGKSGLSKML